MIEDGIREIAKVIRSGKIIDYHDPKYHNYLSQFIVEVPSK